jgi:hypothetical protein
MFTTVKMSGTRTAESTAAAQFTPNGDDRKYFPVMKIARLAVAAAASVAILAAVQLAPAAEQS